jgi:hypothetical protein
MFRKGNIMMKRKAIMHHSITLSRVCSFGLALVVVSLISSTAYALDPMGPPAAELLKGEYKIGLDLSISSQDLDMEQGTWTLMTNGTPSGSGTVNLGTLNDFETYRAYTSFGLNVTRNWEAFLRLGGTRAELGDEFWSDGEEFESLTELTFGGGLRATFYEEIAWKIGGLVQATWNEYDGKVDASHWPGPHFLEIKMFEVQAALGATYLFSDRFSVYAGPFLHMIYGDMDYVYSEADGGYLNTWYFNWDIENAINYGGYLGAHIQVDRNCTFNIEYQQTGNANAIGASLMWRL